MAIRTSGNVRVRILWNDEASQYKAIITVEGERLPTQYVRAPAVLSQAVDCSQAYDDAARAALACAEYETSTEACPDCDVDGRILWTHR